MNKKSLIAITSVVVLIAVIASFVVFGNKNEITKCTLESDFSVSNYEYESVDGNIVKITNEQSTNYNDLGYTGEEAQKLLEEYASKVKGEGIEYTFEIKDNKIIEYLTIDLEKADLTYVEQLGYITSSDSEVISLEDTIENVKDLGGTCKENK